ncbi:MAG TPA: trypsin-like peptidase domain-containing protein [Ktedonobacteraceae bacterium]|nr:trypsin-like peptidase domain-containing protein [Ktedonobacteraceae bacterium]
MQTSSHSGQWLLRTMLAFGFVLLSLSGIIATSATARADGVPGGNIANPVVRAVDIAKPAIVRIITTLGGRLTVHFNSTQSADFPQGGGTYKLELSGSGAFISAHGDILTADHVVRPPHDQELDNFLFETAASDIAGYINQHFVANPPYTMTDVVGALESGFFRAETSYDQATSEAFFSTDYTGPMSASTMQTVSSDLRAPVDQIERESSFNQEDVAIVHVNMEDTPSIALSDSSNIEPQDDLIIIGFPGNGDVSRRGDPTEVLTSSINRVYVSSIKKTDEGAPVIQVGGNVENGDSGGPALDSNGNIVGVVSFFLPRSSPTGSSFLQASNSARALIQQVPVDVKPGAFEKAWRQAFNDYASTAPGHWHKAAQELRQLMLQYSNFQAVKSYLAYAQAQANSEQLPQPAGPNFIWLIAGGVAVLLVLIIGVIVFAARRKRKPTMPVLSEVPTPMAPFGEWQPAPAMQPVGGPSEIVMASFEAPASNVMAPFEVPASNGMAPFHELPTSSLAQPQNGMIAPPPPFPAQTEEQEMSAASTQPYPAVRVPPASSNAPTE